MLTKGARQAFSGFSIISPKAEASYYLLSSLSITKSELSVIQDSRRGGSFSRMFSIAQDTWVRFPLKLNGPFR